MLKKRIKIIAIVLASVIAAIGIYAISVNLYVRYAEDDKVVGLYETGGGYDCIFVLGCGVREDGTPSPMLLDRILAGVTLYEEGAAPILFLSGDRASETYDEVGVMREYAIMYGVKPDDIVIDPYGFSTYESFYRAKEIYGIGSAVVVTQEYHLYRALYDAKQFGIDAIGCAADSREYRGQTMRDIREIVARNKDFLYCLFRIKPKVLGDKTSLIDEAGKS